MITFTNPRPWAHQLNFNSTQTGDITGWANGTALSAARRGQGVLVTNSKVYLIGGFNGLNPITTIYSATINGSGVIGSFSTYGQSLPSSRANVGVALTRDRVYIIGGISNSSDAESTTVYTATIATDGTLGALSAAGSLDTTLSEVTTFIYNNYLYAVGRRDISAAIINSDGTLGTWESKGALDFFRAGRAVWWTGTRLYVWGGSADEMCRYATPTVEGNFTTWNNATSTANYSYRAQCAVVEDFVYLFGGDNDSGTSNSAVYRAPIDSSGVVGSWTTQTSIGLAMHSSALAITSANIYLLGGRTGTTDITTVRYAAFSGGFNNYQDKSYITTNDIVLNSPKESIVMTGGPGKYASISISQAMSGTIMTGSTYDTRASYIEAEFESWQFDGKTGSALDVDFELFECNATGYLNIFAQVQGDFEVFQCDSNSGAVLEDSFELMTADGVARIDLRADIESQFELFEMTGELSWSINAQIEAAFVNFTCDGEATKKDSNQLSGAFELFTCSGEIQKVKACTIDASFIPFSCTGAVSTSIGSDIDASFENFICDGFINRTYEFESIKYVR